MLKYQEREDLDNKEAPKYSLSQINKILKSKEYFLALGDEIDKTTKEYTKTQKVTNISTMIIQLEP